MNCQEFRERMTDLFDLHPEQQAVAELKEHLETCTACAGEYRLSLKVIKKISLAHTVQASTGFKERVMNRVSQLGPVPRDDRGQCEKDLWFRK